MNYLSWCGLFEFELWEGFRMAKKPSHEELEQRLKKLEKEIVELKQSEEELRKSEESYRYLVENASDIIYKTDAMGHFTFFNPISAKTTGYSQEDLYGRHYLDLVHPDYRKSAERNYRLQWTERIPCTYYEFPMVTKDKKEVWLGQHVQLIMEDGRIVGFHAIARDITERKRVEEKLRQSKELFEKTFLAQRGAIFILNSEVPPSITDCNPEATEIFGYSRQEMLGRTTLFLHVNEGSLKKFQEYVYPAIEDQGYCYLPEFEMKKKDGTIFSTEHSLAPLIDVQGQRIGWVSVIHDITGRKLAEEALRKSEERYVLATKAARVGVWDWNVQTNEFHLDGNVKAILGYSDAEIPNNLEVWSGYVHPDDKQPVMEAFQNHIDGKTPEFAYEHRMLHKDGSIRWIMARGVAIRDVQGNPIRVVGTDTDITQRKLAEEALKLRGKELQAKTINLEEANTALKVLLDKRDEDRKELEEKVKLNMKWMVMPYLQKLKKSALNERQEAYSNILESLLTDIISPFTHKLSTQDLDLTPTEIQVAHFVKDGKTTKEVAELLNSSARAIEFHRENIRKKLGLKNKKINLRSHLLSLR
jgi:PAS domain S-box-containing protein